MDGLIYGALVLMWAVVLLPMWVRRHEDRTEVHSMDRFTSGKRILSRRSDAPDHDRTTERREAVVPPLTSTRPAASRDRGFWDEEGQQLPWASSSDRLAARRRRTLVVLLLLSTAVGAAVALGRLPMYAAAVPVVLVLGYLVHLRAEAKRAEQRRRRQERLRRRAERRYAESRLGEVPAYVSVAADAPRRAMSAPAAEVVELADPTAPYDAVAERAWDPVPVPLPTYVTAPRAPRQVRVIDLTSPGAWTSSGHLSEDEAAALEQAEREQAAVADERAEIVDHAHDDAAAEPEGSRRAVGD